jgi:hypothetical protein
MDWQRDLVVEVATQCRIIPRKILKHRRSMRTASGYHSTSRDGSRRRRNLRKGPWLDRAYAQKDEDLYIIKGNPLLGNVAHDPRYAAFLRKMNLPE